MIWLLVIIVMTTYAIRKCLIMIIALFTNHNTNNSGTLLAGGSWFYVSGPEDVGGVFPGNPVTGTNPSLDFTGKLGGNYVYRYTLTEIVGGLICDTDSEYTVNVTETAILNLIVDTPVMHCCEEGVGGTNLFTAVLTNTSDSSPYVGSSTVVWKEDGIVIPGETGLTLTYNSVCFLAETDYIISVEVTTPCNGSPLIDTETITVAPTIYGGVCTMAPNVCETDACVDVTTFWAVPTINSGVIDEYVDTDGTLPGSETTANGDGDLVFDLPTCVDFSTIAVGTYNFKHQQRYTSGGFMCKVETPCTITIIASGTGGTPSDGVICVDFLAATVDFCPEPLNSPTDWHFIAVVHDPPFTCTTPVFDWEIDGVSQSVNALTFDVVVGSLSSGIHTISFVLTCSEGTVTYDTVLNVP